MRIILTGRTQSSAKEMFVCSSLVYSVKDAPSVLWNGQQSARVRCCPSSREERCMRYFSVSVMKLRDQRQLREERVSFGLQFQKESHSGRGGTTAGGQSKKPTREHLQLEEGRGYKAILPPARFYLQRLCSLPKRGHQTGNQVFKYVTTL